MNILWLWRRFRARRAGRPTRTGPTAAARGPVALVLHQALYDLRGFLRNKQGRFFTLALPLLFLVVFVSVFGSDKIGPTNVAARTYYVPGISALAVIAASFVNLVITITGQRESGVLKRRRSSPVPAWVLIASRALTSAIIAGAIVAVIVAIGQIVYGVHLPSSTLPAFVLGVIVGAAAFCCLSFAAASFIRNEDSAQPLIQAIILPLYFISGVLVPKAQLSSTLREIANVFPVSHLDNALFKAFDPATSGSGIAGTDLLILAIWGAVGLLIALRRFKWSPQST